MKYDKELDMYYKVYGKEKLIQSCFHQRQKNIWINNYPRKIFDFQTAEEMFRKEVSTIPQFGKCYVMNEIKFSLVAFLIIL